MVAKDYFLVPIEANLAFATFTVQTCQKYMKEYKVNKNFY